MPLIPGSRIGAHEILGPVGAGGMKRFLKLAAIAGSTHHHDDLAFGVTRLQVGHRFLGLRGREHAVYDDFKFLGVGWSRSTSRVFRVRSQ